MKDLFSGQTKEYAKFRPGYPDELYDYIYSKLNQFQAAWDVATGNGQVANELAKKFDKVFATDISENQIAEAPQKENVEYKIAPAEDSGLLEQSVDLVTIGQALHWFDFDKFYQEVHRVAKPGAKIAAWGYGLFSVNETVDRVMEYFYQKVVGPYWEPERKYVDRAYKDIPFPFPEAERKYFISRHQWNLDHLVGYLKTWSSVKKYMEQKEVDPVENLINEGFEEVWPRDEVKSVLFPVFLLVGQIQ